MMNKIHLTIYFLWCVMCDEMYHLRDICMGPERLKSTKEDIKSEIRKLEIRSWGPRLPVWTMFGLHVATGVGRLNEAELTAWCNNLHPDTTLSPAWTLDTGHWTLDTTLSPAWTLDTRLYQLKHLVSTVNHILSLHSNSELPTSETVSVSCPFLPDVHSSTTCFGFELAHLTSLRSRLVSLVPVFQVTKICAIDVHRQHMCHTSTTYLFHFCYTCLSLAFCAVKSPCQS